MLSFDLINLQHIFLSCNLPLSLEWTSTISAECFVEIIKIIIILFTNIFYTFQQYILHVFLTTKWRMRMVCWNKRSLVTICRYQLLPRRHSSHGGTTNKINGPLGKNVVLHHRFLIILPLYALNNKNTAVTSWGKHVISAWQSKC